MSGHPKAIFRCGFSFFSLLIGGFWLFFISPMRDFFCQSSWAGYIFLTWYFSLFLIAYFCLVCHFSGKGPSIVWRSGMITFALLIVPGFLALLISLVLVPWLSGNPFVGAIYIYAGAILGLIAFSRWLTKTKHFSHLMKPNENFLNYVIPGIVIFFTVLNFFSVVSGLGACK